MPRVTEKDCRSCGACCAIGPAGQRGWADCTVDDVKRMSRAIQSRLVGIQPGWITTDKYWATPTKEIAGQTRCAFLRGTVGRRVSCGVYATRPDVCRKFLPGSRACLHARQDLPSILA